MRISLFGGLRVEAGGEVVSRFRTQKSTALLAYLAYRLPYPQRRDHLIELLWPHDRLSAARSSLSTALWSLRQDLASLPVPPDAWFRADRLTVMVDPAQVTTDLESFEALLRTAEAAGAVSERISALARAVELYGGELLAGLAEDWIFNEQTRLEVRYQDSLRALIDLYEQRGQLAAARELAARGVRSNPLCEETCLRLLRLYAATGQSAAALEQYRELERLLKRELDTQPGPDLQAFARSLARSGTTWLSPGAPPAAAAEPPRAHPAHVELCLESVGGAVPLQSRLYVERPADGELCSLLDSGESIVLLTGPRQCGKSSLLARGLQHARRQGSVVALTDFQSLDATAFESTETLLRALAECLAELLELPRAQWLPELSPSLNLRRYLRSTVFPRIQGRLLWAFDEVDRLFPCPFGVEVFSLFRSWHNERALDPASPWNRLSLVMAYATEAHLFVADLNQSPFNVGTRLELEDFTPDQVERLNQLHGSPLSGQELEDFRRLAGGHPYLVRRGLRELSRGNQSLASFREAVRQGGGPYKDHLRRLLLALLRDADLCDQVKEVLAGRACTSDEEFFRLRSAGILTGGAAATARFRCELYREYLERQFRS